MNIDSLGSETVELLIKENLVNTISDLYLLNTDDLLPLKKDGKKWYENIVFGIENSKRFLLKDFYLLGIRHVGETVKNLLIILLQLII